MNTGILERYLESVDHLLDELEASAHEAYDQLLADLGGEKSFQGLELVGVRWREGTPVQLELRWQTAAGEEVRRHG